MASTSSIICSIILCFFIISAAGRAIPAGNKNNKKLEKDCVDAVGMSMGSAGFVFGVGTSSGNSNGAGEGSNGNGIGDFDHSGPAASNGQYVPGNDDTFVPNTGYEIPNPSYVGSGTTP